jgi:hypothetical protein
MVLWIWSLQRVAILGVKAEKRLTEPGLQVRKNYNTRRVNAEADPLLLNIAREGIRL